MAETSMMLHFAGHRPRRNLPLAISRKRGESNYVSAFAEAYVTSMSSSGIGGREFALSNFGIADFIWIAWRKRDDVREATALSLECLKAQLLGHRLTAFELKLNDWRKALMQAYRYSYFADCAIVVLPPLIANAAKLRLDLFQTLSVGLWSFDKEHSTIRRIFTSRDAQPRNAAAREKAIELISRNFRKAHKQLRSLA